MAKKVLTIQDISCVGQCSLTVALPIISCTGIETCVIPSAVLSTHTGGKFVDYTFRDLTDEIKNIRKSWQKNNLKFDILYTGYINSLKQFDYIKEIIDTCLVDDKKIIIDPVMGDFGEFYKGFDKKIAKRMREFCKNADIIIPNITEACLLLDIPYKNDDYDKNYIEDILIKLSNLGVKNVVLTGVSFEKNQLGVAIYDSINRKVEYVFNEKINQNFHGTGDIFASSLVGAIANGKDIKTATKIATEFVVKSINETLKENDKTHWYGVRFEKALPYLVAEINK